MFEVYRMVIKNITTLSNNLSKSKVVDIQ